MRVIRIKKNSIGRAALAAALEVLRSGGVVAYPTETSYGLAADPQNALATAKIFAIKGRSAEKRLPLIAGSAGDAKKAVKLSGRLAALTRDHWPGPLTVVAPLRKRRGGSSVSQFLGFSVSSPTIAIRVPSSPVARRLAAAFGRTITSTSANLSGAPPSFSGVAVRRAFAGRRYRPDLLLDAGRLPPRPPSTIVAIEHGRIKVVRQGAVRL